MCAVCLEWYGIRNLGVDGGRFARGALLEKRSISRLVCLALGKTSSKNTAVDFVPSCMQWSLDSGRRLGS